MPFSVDGRQTFLKRPAERARPTGLSPSRRDKANVRTDFVAPCQHTGTAGGFQSLPPCSSAVFWRWPWRGWRIGGDTSFLDFGPVMILGANVIIDTSQGV